MDLNSDRTMPVEISTTNQDLGENSGGDSKPFLIVSSSKDETLDLDSARTMPVEISKRNQHLDEEEYDNNPEPTLDLREETIHFEPKFDSITETATAGPTDFVKPLGVGSENKIDIKAEALNLPTET